MIFRAWTETRTLPIKTGSDFVVTNEGDLVVVAVVKRWEDVARVAAAIAGMTSTPEAEK